jgi:MFS family permease
LIYIPASWYGGRFAQRRGYFSALKLGFGAMAIVLTMGTWFTSLTAQTLVMAVWTIAVCFTWAPLEALASHGENRGDLARMIGIYNVVWSSGAAVAFFSGGALQQALGPASLYWFPAALHAFQFALLLWLERQARSSAESRAENESKHDQPPPDFAQHHIRPEAAKAFLRMAWVANPFAYIAMNTVIPLIPDLAARLNLSTALAGFVASTWMFARLGAFALLWRWTAWHYRFGWLFASYGVMLLSFATLLLAAHLALVILAQVAFGLAVGLIYSSSLFYSMDVGVESQGEHGGRHEALIGIGIFLGPAIGTTTGYLAPGVKGADVLAVGASLIVGLAALVFLRRRSATCT